MKESYGEGVASHTGPDSCGGGSNVTAEALTGGHAGGLLSSEIKSFRVPTLWSEGEGNTDCGAIASCSLAGGVVGTLACVEAPCAGTGRSSW